MTKVVNLVLTMLVLALFCAPIAYGQTTQFTYQGNLKDTGLTANGSYDFEFRLFTDVSGGSQVGPAIFVAPVAVVDGVFSVNLDFGETVFPGADRYLQIAVRKTDIGGLTPLSPRQKITSAPYAISSLRAASATTAVLATNAQSLGGVIASQYVLTTDSRMTDARNPLGGSGNYIQNTTSPQATSNFNISGTGSAGTFNAATGYNFGGSHLISAGGSDNVFAGSFSGLLNLGNSNAFFGSRAGQENKQGRENSFFGAYAGQNNVTGNNNSFFGYFAGNSTTSGSENSFFGNRAGQINTTGAFNSFFGTFSGLFNTAGSDNSFFGNETGYNNSIGNRNSFFGSKAGRSNSTGEDNAFLGSFAGQSNASGSNNAFVGSKAGQLNTAGQNNSFFGAGAGLNNAASNNTFAGADSGKFNTTGANNSFFGRNAGLTNTEGELNVFIGTNAGQSNTHGRLNTIIGAEANVVGPNLSYATAIGAEAVVNSNNTVVLGRPVDAVRIPGNLNILGTLSAGTISISAANLTGIVPVANGGTGLSSAGMSGRFLRSTGSTWQSLPFTVDDIPAGSTLYVQNTTSQQGSTNFNISGNGTAGGTLWGNAVNSSTQYNIGGNRVLLANGTNLFAGFGAGNAITTGTTNSFVGNSAGSANSSGTSNSFFGANAGLNSISGNNNTFAGVNAGAANTSGAGNAFFGANAGQTNTVGSNNTVLGSNANVGSNNLTYATAIGADAVVSTNNTVVLGRSIDTVRAPGNLQVDGNLIANNISVSAANITGVVAVANGGTGMNSPGASGNFLRSNGSIWQSSAIAAGDIPAGSGNYIQNGVGVQASSNFNISGNGVVGGTFTANGAVSGSQYNIAGTRVLANTGTANIFVGQGTATTGNDNTFVGFSAGSANTTGFSNTLLGSGSNLGAGNLSFASAIGAGATVSNNNSVVLGRSADTVRVPGNLTVTGTFSAPSFTLPATSITGILPAANGGTGIGVPGTVGNFLRSTGSGWQSQPLAPSDIPSGSTNYIQNGSTPQAGAQFNIAGNGAIGGNLTVGGTISGTFTVPATSITGVLPIATGGTGLSSVGSNGHFLRSNGTAWTTALLTAADIPSLASSYVQNTSTQQVGANFNIGGNGTIGGNLTVTGALNANVAASNITGVLGVSNGGTGVNSPGGIGNFLRSNGTIWTSSALSASDIPSLASSYVQNTTTQQVGANFNIGGNGTIGGNLTVSGTFNANVAASNITGVLGASNGGTGLSSPGANGNILRSNGTNWTSSGLTASDIPTGSTNYIQNGTTPQSGANFNIAGDGTIGDDLTVNGDLILNGSFTGAYTVPVANISGTLGAGNGGTGLTTSTGTNFLRGNGSGGWTSGTLTAGDIPSLGGTYILNQTGQQATSNFNVSGSGTVGTTMTVGTTLTADTVNAVTQYNINGNRVFATTGTNNIFAGAGTGNTGSSNSFFGANAGDSNTTGSSNTIVGANADVGSGSLSNAAAIGANAQVTQSNSVVIGGITGVNGGTNTNVGIGTTAPKAKLEVSGGNILVGSPGQGIVLKSPDGLKCSLLSIDNTGAAVWTVLASCPS